jgi:hypothetical protein
VPFGLIPPVVRSSGTSPPEAGDDAIVYFDPHSIGEMADASERVLDSPALHEEITEMG